MKQFLADESDYDKLMILNRYDFCNNCYQFHAVYNLLIYKEDTMNYLFVVSN